MSGRTNQTPAKRQAVTRGIPMPVLKTSEQQRKYGKACLYRNAKDDYINIMADPRVWRGITTDLYKKGALMEDASKTSLRQSHSSTVYGSALRRAGHGHEAVKKAVPAQRRPMGRPRNSVAAGDHIRPPNVLLEPLDGPVDSDMLYEAERRRLCPVTPPLIPATTFADASTDIPLGQLFRFDVHVKPLLEILIGQAIEQGLLEVFHEETHLTREEEDHARQIDRNHRRAERQRLQGQTQRCDQEKKMRLLETEVIGEAENDAADEGSMRAFARAFFDALIPNAFQRLRDKGYFKHPVRVEMEAEFLPWICENVDRKLDEYYAVNLVVQGMVRAALIENRRELSNAVKMAQKVTRL